MRAQCVLAALCLIVVVAAPASAATTAPSPPSDALTAGSIGLRLLDSPVTNDPRARLYIVDHLAPSAIIHRRIEVENTSDSATHVILYAAAATVENGSFLGAAGHTPNDLSTWTTVKPRASDIPAGGRLTATVTIKVPSDGPPGEQYGVVWAEARSTPKKRGGVVQVNRVGVRIYLSVGPGGAPAADFTIDSLTAERSAAGQPMVLAEVHNTGGRALDMNGVLRLLHGPSGLTAGPFAASLGTTLAIADTEPVTILLDNELPAGPWDADITLKSGLIEHSAHARIRFPAVGAAPAVRTASTQPGWLYPAIAGTALLLLLATIVRLIMLRRRKRRRGGTLTGGLRTFVG